MRETGISSGARLKVVLLPNKAWQPLRHLTGEGSGPDSDRLQRLMAERGIDFVVVDPFRWPYNPFAGAHPLFSGIDPLRGIMVLLRYRSADLVISVFESSSIVLLALRRTLFFKPPIALWDVSVGSTWRPRRLVLRFVLPLIDRLFLLSRWQGTATEQQYRLRHPAEVIGHAIDEDFFHPMFNRAEDHVLSVGDDVARDYSTFVTAVKELPISVVLRSSSVPDVSAPHAAQIHVIRERVSFVHLRDLYASASLVVIPLRPSDHPSGITALFEAMAMGKAIIVSDVQMVRDFINPDQTGLIVPVSDPVALRDAIAFLVARPHERRRLGRNARLHLESNLSMASFANRYAECIRRAVIPRPRW